MNRRPSLKLPDDICDEFSLPRGFSGPVRTIKIDGVVTAWRGFLRDRINVAEFHDVSAFLQLQEDTDPKNTQGIHTLIIFSFRYVSLGYRFPGDRLRLAMGFGNDIDSPFWNIDISVPCHVRDQRMNYGFVGDASLFGVSGDFSLQELGIFDPTPPRCLRGAGEDGCLDCPPESAMASEKAAPSGMIAP